MTYGCGCASMFTYGTCIAATSCHACKERGFITETDGKPNCDICSCAFVIGAFKQSEIMESRIRCLQEQESAAKAANAPKDDIFSRANASVASMMKQLVMEAAKITSHSSSGPSMKNIVSATASAMSRKQLKSEEILYNLQRRQGAPSTRLKHTSVCVRELLGSGLVVMRKAQGITRIVLVKPVLEAAALSAVLMRQVLGMVVVSCQQVVESRRQMICGSKNSLIMTNPRTWKTGRETFLVSTLH